MEPSAQIFLLETQHRDGGWGYAPGHAATVEATSAAVLALAPAEAATASLERAVAWLAAAQHNDGGWGLGADDPASGWQTAWAVLALTAAGQKEAETARGSAWLLRVQLALVEKPEDVNWTRVTLGIDPSLRGWPWQPGQASWVEPTALALQALAPQTAAPTVRPRLDEAIRYLQDRRCRGGGWNVGNPVMFSQPLPPRACPTAWVLIALAKLAPAAILDDDLATLRREMYADGSASALGWGLWTLRVLGHAEPQAASRLRDRQAANGGWNENPYHTAIALLALREQNA